MGISESTLETGCFSCVLEGNMSNTPITLSRECIRDTYLAKRQAHGKLDGLILGVYNQNMRILRSGQLRPYQA